MTPRSVVFLALLSCTACALIRPPPPPSRYEVGDYIVYRYTGMFTPAPVTLREQVIAKQGNKLTIDDVATRGSEQRHWIQVVTDTPENEKKNVVDELYEVDGKKRRRLENVNNRDRLELYAWTYILPADAPTDTEKTEVSINIAGKDYRCSQETGLIGWHSRTLRFRTDDCPDFVWTHGPSRYWDNHFGDDILTARIVDAGNVRNGVTTQTVGKTVK